MSEKNKSKKVNYRPLKNKIFQFIVAYVIINYIFSGSFNLNFFNDNNVKDLYVDGTNFTLLANLSKDLIGTVYAIIILVLRIIIELLTVIVFKNIYFKSIMEDNEKTVLKQYIKIVLFVCYMINICISVIMIKEITLINIIGYSILPVLTIIFINSKIKKITCENKED